MKKVFTTGEVARLCGLSPATVIRLFDRGLIEGFRLPSGDRRIPYDSLVQFMREHGIPLKMLEEHRIKVLIVDDDPRICNVLEAAFAGDEYEVRVAHSGFEGGLAAKEMMPDVILLDIVLGDVDGRKVCKTVRADPQLQQTKVIAISGKLSRSELERLSRDGFDGALMKPLKPSAVRRTVEELLKQAHEP